MLGISVRHVWALVADGRLPRPMHLGRAARWSVDELRACIASRAFESPQTETAE
jgi:predicted DNA-binding transcriptional regulator AlpA